MDLQKTFHAIEGALVDYGSRRMPRDELLLALQQFKMFDSRELTDDKCYEILVDVTFYSGFKAATVTKRRPAIREHFADYRDAAQFGKRDVERLLADKNMIRNRRKIEACISNARLMCEIVAEHGSFQHYIQSFHPEEAFENVLLLKEELQGRFSYLGEITTYHFLKDLGMPVLKPDLVISRIFKRLGLVEYDKQHLKTVIWGQKFAEATGLPIRYIDIVLVLYGQASSPNFGIDRGICLNKPRCEYCRITEHCLEFQKNGMSRTEGDG